MGHHDCDLFEQIEDLQVRELEIRRRLIDCLDTRLGYVVFPDCLEKFKEALIDYRNLVPCLIEEVEARLERINEIAKFEGIQ